MKICAFRQAYLRSEFMKALITGIKASGDDCEETDDLEEECDLALFTSG